jgi:hypothetical protein
LIVLRRGLFVGVVKPGGSGVGVCAEVRGSLFIINTHVVDVFTFEANLRISSID